MPQVEDYQVRINGETESFTFEGVNDLVTVITAIRNLTNHSDSTMEITISPNYVRGE